MSRPPPRFTAIRIHPSDNVVCLLRDHDAGERPSADGVAVPPATGPIPAGHKVALTAIASGESVIKYGQPIGRATQAIAPGDHVHLHNLRGLTASEEA